MLKKVFDPNKMKKSCSLNIELVSLIQNRALKVSFGIKHLIFGSNAKEGF